MNILESEKDIDSFHPKLDINNYKCNKNEHYFDQKVPLLVDLKNNDNISVKVEHIYLNLYIKRKENELKNNQ